MEWIKISVKVSGTNDISEKPTYIGLVNEAWSHGNNFLPPESLLAEAFLIPVCSNLSVNRHGKEN